MNFGRWPIFLCKTNSSIKKLNSLVRNMAFLTRFIATKLPLVRKNETIFTDLIDMNKVLLVLVVVRSIHKVLNDF